MIKLKIIFFILFLPFYLSDTMIPKNYRWNRGSISLLFKDEKISSTFISSILWRLENPFIKNVDILNFKLKNLCDTKVTEQNYLVNSYLELNLSITIKPKFYFHRLNHISIFQCQCVFHYNETEFDLLQNFKNQILEEIYSEFFFNKPIIDINLIKKIEEQIIKSNKLKDSNYEIFFEELILLIDSIIKLRDGYITEKILPLKKLEELLEKKIEPLNKRLRSPFKDYYLTDIIKSKQLASFTKFKYNLNRIYLDEELKGEFLFSLFIPIYDENQFVNQLGNQHQQNCSLNNLPGFFTNELRPLKTKFETEFEINNQNRKRSNLKLYNNLCGQARYFNKEDNLVNSVLKFNLSFNLIPNNLLKEANFFNLFNYLTPDFIKSNNNITNLKETIYKEKDKFILNLDRRIFAFNLNAYSLFGEYLGKNISYKDFENYYYVHKYEAYSIKLPDRINNSFDYNSFKFFELLNQIEKLKSGYLADDFLNKQSLKILLEKFNPLDQNLRSIFKNESIDIFYSKQLVKFEKVEVDKNDNLFFKNSNQINLYYTLYIPLFNENQINQIDNEDCLSYNELPKFFTENLKLLK